MSDFNVFIGPLLGREGSQFVTNDNGRGCGRYGVTLSSYLEYKPDATCEDIEALTPACAGEFYSAQFWNRYHIGLLNDQGVADKVADLAVNCGGGTAVRMLQTVIGVPVDGSLGPNTAAMANKADPTELVGALRIAAAEHYQAIAEANPAEAHDLPGWLARNQAV